MGRRDQRDYQDGDPPEVAGRGFVRRGRRFTPPGESIPRGRFSRLRRPAGSAAVQIGDVVAELTPRQATVWLMNLETMVSLYESTTEQQLDPAARERLAEALRAIVRDHSLR